MKVIIIEDERPAAEMLLLSINACNSNIELLAVLGSVQASVEWLQQNPLPDHHLYGHPAYRWAFF